MLLGDVVLPVDVPLQRGEDALSLQQRVPASPLELQQVVGRDPFRVRAYRRLLAVRRWDHKVFELFPQDDDGLLGEEGRLEGGDRWWIVTTGGGAVVVDAGLEEEGEDVRQTGPIKLLPSSA